MVQCPHGSYYSWWKTFGALGCSIYDTCTGAAATLGAAHDKFCTHCPAGKACPIAIGGDRDVTVPAPTASEPGGGILDCVEGTWSNARATQCIVVEPGFKANLALKATGQDECGQT